MSQTPSSPVTPTHFQSDSTFEMILTEEEKAHISNIHPAITQLPPLKNFSTPLRNRASIISHFSNTSTPQSHTTISATQDTPRSEAWQDSPLEEDFQNIEQQNEFYKKIMDQFPFAEKNMKFLHKDGYYVYVIGTAHVLEESAQQVEKVIREVNPVLVLVELDAQRKNFLYPENALKENSASTPLYQFKDQLLSIWKQLQQEGVGIVILKHAMSFVSKKLSKQVNSNQILLGQEFKSAYKICKELDAKIVLADRPVGITLARMWNTLTFVQKCKLFASAFWNWKELSQISKEDVLQLKNSSQDEMNQLFSQLEKEFPNLKKVLIDERDAFMAKICLNSIKELQKQRYEMQLRALQEASQKENSDSTVPKEPFIKEEEGEEEEEENIMLPKANRKIVLVCGKGHLEGVSKYFEDSKRISMRKILHVPTVNPLKTVLIFIVWCILLSLSIYNMYYYFQQEISQTSIPKYLNQTANATALE